MAPEVPFDDYFMKSDDEVSRLSTNHYIIKAAMGDRLLFAPLDLASKPLRILDVATADGTWMIDFQKSCPPTSSHQFVGIDIDPTVFPTKKTPGITYEVQDINKPWPADWRHTFDVVHQRLALVAAGANAQAMLKNVSDLVKPGGWIQLIEADMERTAEMLRTDVPHAGPTAHDFFNLTRDLFTTLGVKLDMSTKMADWLREDGFVEVGDRQLDIQLGATNPDPQLAKNGVFATGVAVTALAGFAKTLPPTALSMPTERLDSLKDDLEAELATTGMTYPFRVIWGRRPS